MGLFSIYPLFPLLSGPVDESRLVGPPSLHLPGSSCLWLVEQGGGGLAVLQQEAQTSGTQTRDHRTKLQSLHRSVSNQVARCSYDHPVCVRVGPGDATILLCSCCSYRLETVLVLVLVLVCGVRHMLQLVIDNLEKVKIKSRG